MILTLIAKRRESDDGHSWYSFSTRKNGKWYNVRFVRDCCLPTVYKITDNVFRSFIKLEQSDNFDVTQRVGRLYLYIENFSELSDDELKAAGAAERESIENYRKAREVARTDFLEDNGERDFINPKPVDDAEFPW